MSTGSSYAKAQAFDPTKSALQQLRESVLDGPIASAPLHQPDFMYSSITNGEASANFSLPPGLQAALPPIPGQYQQQISQPSSYAEEPFHRPGIPAGNLQPSLPYAPRGEHMPSPFEVKTSMDGGEGSSANGGSGSGSGLARGSGARYRIKQKQNHGNEKPVPTGPRRKF